MASLEARLVEADEAKAELVARLEESSMMEVSLEARLEDEGMASPAGPAGPGPRLWSMLPSVCEAGRYLPSPCMTPSTRSWWLL